MKRIFLIIASVALLMGLAAPAVLAASPTATQDKQVVLVFNGDAAVPAGEQADVVLVTNGTATIAGDVQNVVVFHGSAVVQTGATLQNVFVADGSVSLAAGTTVSGDVRTLDATVTQDPAAIVGGEVRAVDADLIAFGLAIAPAIVLFFLGFALVTIVAGLALAALAARQVRSAEALIRDEPLETFIFGLAGLIVVPLVAILAMVTIIGAPLGLALLLMVWPAAAFAGYLVAGIWIGEWLLYRNSATRPDRPYLASVLGLIVLQVAGIVPFVTPIASLFGFGAVLLLAWRTFRRPGPQAVVTPPAAQPMGA
jgi:hypothetical protein